MDATHIEDVVSEFVSLKKRGANLIGCCPFHNEKTPSFNVSPARNIYKCFGCGESGNAVGFLMKHEKYSYPEALRWLAKKYNIEIQEEQLTQEQKERNTERDALYHVSEFAQKYFAQLLTEDEMGRAIGLSYFHNRGLSDPVIKEFGLGYCLEQWDNFTKYARRSGYSDNVLQKTGLTIFTDDGKCYDRFRGRVMFPIYSVSGRVLGFSGRILSKEKQAAKYVNSPDSEIYNKSHILYGLYQARTAIARHDKCYLVEGNIDVISMYQSGVENTVASCGTSLTIEQVRLMRRYTKNVTVLYDGDKAGIKAAFRAVNMLFEEGMHVRVVLFPDDEDPDSYAQKYGSTKLQEYLRDNETNFILFKTRVLADDIKGDPIRKAEILNDIVRTVALVPDLMERTEYVKQCASLLHIPEVTLQNELAKVLNRKLYEGLQHTPDPNDKDLREPPPPAPGQPLDPPGLDAPPEASDAVANQQQAAAAAVRQQQQALSQIFNPSLAQEKQIVSLLLNYGNEVIELDGKDEQGNDVKLPYTVAQVIVGDLMNDQLSFDDITCQAIFNDFAQQVADGVTSFDIQRFVDHPDPLVRDMAVTLMMNSYQISDNWAKMKNIYVPLPESRIKEDVAESLWTFKDKKLKKKMADIDAQFPYVNNDDDRLILMAQKMALAETLRKLDTNLHRVIT